MPVHNQRKAQQNHIGDHIQCSEGNGDQLIQTCHKGLEGIHTQGSGFENANTDGADHNAHQRHQNSSFLHKYFLSLTKTYVDSIPYFPGKINTIFQSIVHLAWISGCIFYTLADCISRRNLIV